MIESLGHFGKSCRFQKVSLPEAGAGLNELIDFSAAPNGLIELAGSISNLFDSFEILAADPANLPLRRTVVRSARNVAAQLNRAHGRLNAVKKDLNAVIQKDTARANQCLKEIAALNGQIAEAHAMGAFPGLLAGQRRQLLQELSASIKITVISQDNGSVNVAVGGVMLVAGAATPDILVLSPDKNGNMRLQAQHAGPRLKLAGGIIARKITARDTGLAALQAGLNHLAAQLIAQGNTIYMSRCGWNGRSGQDLFSGTDASNVCVKYNNIVREPALLPAPAAKERRRAGDIWSDRETSELQWYEQASAAFGAMTARLEQMQPMQ